MHDFQEQHLCMSTSRDNAPTKSCSRNPRPISEQATSSDHNEHQRLAASFSRLQSHPVLLQSDGQVPIEVAIKDSTPSFGCTYSRRSPNHSVRDEVLADPGHHKTTSAIVHPDTLIQSLSPSDSASPQTSLSYLRASWNVLPGEVRNRVYGIVLASCSTVVDLHANRTHKIAVFHERQAYLKLLPGLAYVNRQTYSEYTTFLFENRTLSVYNLKDLYYLEDILDALPGQKGWNSVKSIRFPRFSDLASSPARARELFDCISRCRNIGKLTLQVKLDLLHMPNDSPAYQQFLFLNHTPGIKSPEQVAANYELGVLFDLPHLHKLTMLCSWRREGPVPCTPRTMITFWDLQDWVAQGFTTYARDVEEVIMSLPFNEPKEFGAWTIRLKRQKKKNVNLLSTSHRSNH